MTALNCKGSRSVALIGDVLWEGSLRGRYVIHGETYVGDMLLRLTKVEA